MTQHTSYPTAPQTNPSPLFAQVLREGSNYEIAWLWAATKLSRPEEVRYCLERALYINPHSQAARLGLQELAQAERAAARESQSQRLGNPLKALASRLFGAGLF